jgi:hypothetical protein
MARRLRPEDLLPTERERWLAKQAQKAPEEARGWGGTLGKIVGGGIGALGYLGDVATGGASLGAIGTATTALGAGVGGALGESIGGAIGDSQAEGYESEGLALEAKRAENMNRWQRRRAALQALLSRDQSIG